jgi:hypothetical protein
MIGEKYNQLTIIELVRTEKKNRSYTKIVKCLCSCGNMVERRLPNLKSGCTKSCGCYNKKLTIERNTKHNQAGRKTRTREYITWMNMIQRTTNPNNPKYPLYGGINIGVCDEWRKFENFLKDMGKRPIGKSLERNDNKKGYYKENCSWATPKEQANNRGNKIR